MYKACTCAFRRALTVHAEALASNVSKSTSITSAARRSAHERSFSAIHARRYPRQATPFSPANARLNESSSITETAAGETEEIETPEASTSDSASTSSSSSWYLSETPSIPSTSNTSSAASSSSSTRNPAEIPSPPATLPTYLEPLWTHLYESPFLDQQSINFIDSKAVQDNASLENMDASVTSWVDWVVVASLRNGRERGIRGASEGVKTAMLNSLRIFDEQLAAAEEAAAVSSPSNASNPPKRKKKVSPVLLEGLDIKEPQWALIDGGKAVIHVMTSKARRTWQVEGVASGFSEVKKKRVRIGEEVELEQEEQWEEEEDQEESDLSDEDYPKTSTQTSSREQGEFQPRM